MRTNGHWLLANGESVLGGCLARLGPGPEARRLLEQGYRTLLEALGPEHDRTREARQRLRQFKDTSG